LSLATLVGDAGDTRLSGIAAGMLHDQDAAVGEQAERALIMLALAVLREESLDDPALAPLISSIPAQPLVIVAARGLKGTHDELCLHLAEAATTFSEHRRRGPIIAAVLIGGRERVRGAGPGARALRSWLRASQHPSHSVLRSVLRWSKAPLARLRALEWLSSDGLAIACADRLMRGRSLLEHELVLRDAHLMARPRRQARVAGAKLMVPGRKPARGGGDAEESVPSSGALRRLSPAARRGLPGFLAGLGVPPKPRWTALEALLSDDDPCVRYAAMKAAPSAGLVEFCFDRDPRIARGAFLRSSVAGAAGVTAGGIGARGLGLMARLPHAELRAWSAQEPTGAPGPASVLGRLALRRAMRDDRHAMIEQLQGALTSKEPRKVLEALGQVRVLGLVEDLAGHILKVAAGESTDPRVIATAVALLAWVQSPRAAEVALARLSYTDPRVRANAVEALGRINRRTPQSRPQPHPAAFIEAKDDPHHRVRANALRGSWGSGCVEDLATMLGDERPMHRLAATWVAQRLLPGGDARLGDRWSELTARVSELARFDEDPRVKARAAACARRCETNLRATWVQGAAS
jgi:hypothetical protein